MRPLLRTFICFRPEGARGLVSVMINHMTWVIDPILGTHQLAYENLLTILFGAFQASLKVVWPLTKKNIIYGALRWNVIAGLLPAYSSEGCWTYFPIDDKPASCSRSSNLTSSSSRLVEGATGWLSNWVGLLKNKLIMHQQDHSARVDMFLKLLASSPSPSASWFP